MGGQAAGAAHQPVASAAAVQQQQQAAVRVDTTGVTVSSNCLSSSLCTVVVVRVGPSKQVRRGAQIPCLSPCRGMVPVRIYVPVRDWSNVHVLLEQVAVAHGAKTPVLCCAM